MYQATAPDPLSDDDLSAWRKAIAAARKAREDASERYGWQDNIDRYAPPDAKKAEGHVNIGADFADVERKKAALLFTTPEIAFVCDEPAQPLEQPQPPQPGQQPQQPPTLGSLTLAHQQLVNELLSESQLNVKATALKSVLDVLLPAGVGPVHVGYRAITETLKIDVPDPMTGEPVSQDAPVPIHEEFFVSRISPKAMLLPKEFRDTDIRQAAWVGYEFTMPVSQLRAEYDIPEEVDIPTGQEKPFFNEDREGHGDAVDPPVSGCYIEYRGMLYGKSKHPKAVWCLVLVDGMDTPIKHRPSPHQTFDESGRLTPDSLPDYSILPLWIRDLPDSAWVPSDCTITAPLTKELNKFRTQSITQRDNQRTVILYDTQAFPPEVIDKIEKGDIGTFIGVKGGQLSQGAPALMSQVATPSLGRESYLGQDYIQADREKILGISANQTGANASRKTTATEASIVNKNTEARFNQEQDRVRAWYISVVRVLDTLILRYGDEKLASALLGPQKGAFWAKYKGFLAGGYRYEVQTDSGKYMDAEAQRRQWLQFYQLVRQDPLVNAGKVVQKLLSFWGIDPTEGMAQPQPPQPPPPQVGVSFKGEDFNPLNPQFDLVVKMAQQGGWQITPEDIQNAKANAQQMQSNALIAQAMNGPATPGQPKPSMKHGGPAPQQMPISKRVEDETGGINNAPGGGQ